MTISWSEFDFFVFLIGDVLECPWILFDIGIHSLDNTLVYEHDIRVDVHTFHRANKVAFLFKTIFIAEFSPFAFHLRLFSLKILLDKIAVIRQATLDHHWVRQQAARHGTDEVVW